MGKINHTLLKNELIRDPLGLGYKDKTYDEIVEEINKKQFSEAKLVDTNTGSPVFYVTGKTGTSGVTTPGTSAPILNGVGVVYEKRTRAELLFGPDTVVEREDVRLAYMS